MSRQVGQKSDGGEDAEDYNPYVHREVTKPTTYIETLAHAIKCNIGTGMLALPQAFKFSGGTLTGVASSFVIAGICTYCLHMLVASLYVLSKRSRVPILTYANAMRTVLETGSETLKPFSNTAGIVTDVFTIIYQTGICCVYIVFVADNVKLVADQHLKKPLPIEMYMLMFLVPFILICMIRKLKYLAPFSAAANLVMFFCFGAILYFVFQDLPNFSERPLVGSLAKYPLYFGTFLFSIVTIPVMVALENNMKKPEQFGGYFGIINISLLIITILYVGMGLFGYWRHGDNVKPSITLNLPKDYVLSAVVQVSYSVVIYITYALQLYVPLDIIWNNYILAHMERSSHILAWEYTLRVCLVLLTYVFAIAVPYLGLIISFFGALCLTTLGMIFPAFIDICIKSPGNLGRCKWILVKDLLIIIFATFGLIAGVYASIYEIIIMLSEREIIVKYAF